MRNHVLLLVLLTSLLLVARARADWGNDIGPGAGAPMVAEVQHDLLKIVELPEEKRAERVASFLKRGGKHTVEALKRFRNPELKVLFHALLDHPDWHLQHRGFLALEYLGDTSVLDRAWLALEHPERRMREKAAITCIKLWDGRPAPEKVDALLERERNYHVRRCLEALKRRIAGDLPVERVYEEHVLELENGLRVTPFLGGMDSLPKVAPGYVAKPEARQGAGSAARLDAAGQWTTPLLGYGEEEVPGVGLQPFANLRQGGTVHHVGHDVGACLDGSGLYAPAAGVVKLVHTGSDLGTLLVVEHKLPGGRLVNGVYMHCGDTVFVEPGELVEPGQLLGTMGLSFSIENGGHFAHLHYGLYPGPFDARHNYGYKPVSAGLRDWYDPAAFLPAWIERTAPPVDEVYPPSPALASAAQKTNKGEYGRAYAEAIKLRDRVDRRSDEWADADEIVQAVRGAPRRGLRRADALVEGGYPRDAVAFLKSLKAACRGIPGVEKIDAQLDQWKEDDTFKLGLKGQSKVADAELKALKERDPAKRREMWRKLLSKYGRTCLAERIREQLED